MYPCAYTINLLLLATQQKHKELKKATKIYIQH